MGYEISNGIKAARERPAKNFLMRSTSVGLGTSELRKWTIIISWLQHKTIRRGFDSRLGKHHSFNLAHNSLTHHLLHTFLFNCLIYFFISQFLIEAYQYMSKLCSWNNAILNLIEDLKAFLSSSSESIFFNLRAIKFKNPGKSMLSFWSASTSLIKYEHELL